MRVTLVTHEASRTGAPRVAGLVVRGLVEQGHKVSVVSRTDGPLMSDFESSAPTSVEPLWRVRRKLRSIFFIRSIVFVMDTIVAAALIVGTRAELLYVNSSAAAIYLRPARWLRRPVVLHMHESGEVASWFLTKARATHFIHGVQVVACSPSVQREIALLIGVHPDTIKMLPSVPNDAEVIRLSVAEPDYDYPPGDLVVGCCGAVESRKGADLWVDAARQVDAAMPPLPRIHFVWVGEGAPPDLATEERDQIAFVGPSANPYAHMRRFNIFTLPSRDDPFPLVVLEAMTLGTPVVAFGVGGVSEQVGDAGIVVPPGDVAGLAAGIVRLLKDDYERRELGLAGKSRVKNHYSTASFIDALRDVVRGVREPLR